MRSASGAGNVRVGMLYHESQSRNKEAKAVGSGERGTVSFSMKGRKRVGCFGMLPRMGYENELNVPQRLVGSTPYQNAARSLRGLRFLERWLPKNPADQPDGKSTYICEEGFFVRA